MQKEFAAFIGIDWADRKHDVCLGVPGVEKHERSVLEHLPAAIRQWAEKLRERFQGAPVAVCLELTHRPIVSALLEHNFFVLFPVQPATLARYRNAFTTSRAKDDPTDAEIALELLLRHPDKLSRLKPESVAMRSLRRLVEARRSLVDDRVRLTNRSFLNSARACAAIELFDVEIARLCPELPDYALFQALPCRRTSPRAAAPRSLR